MDASAEQIREAYLIRSKMFHPDRFDQKTQARSYPKTINVTNLAKWSSCIHAAQQAINFVKIRFWDSFYAEGIGSVADSISGGVGLSRETSGGSGR